MSIHGIPPACLFRGVAVKMARKVDYTPDVRFSVKLHRSSGRFIGPHVLASTRVVAVCVAVALASVTSFRSVAIT